MPTTGRQSLDGTSVCYEDAYGSTQLPALRTATMLVNVTNDAWFGHSTARYQHLQLSRMRAMEAGRPMVRAANDGVSAVIGARGELIARAPEYEASVLRAEDDAVGIVVGGSASSVHDELAWGRRWCDGRPRACLGGDLARCARDAPRAPMLDRTTARRDSPRERVTRRSSRIAQRKRVMVESSRWKRFMRWIRLSRN